MATDTPEVVVILAAGLGSRLRTENAVPKPLMTIGGRPLVARVIDRFYEAGIREVVVVLGYRADDVKSGILSSVDRGDITFVLNHRYELSNGLSVLSAREVVGKRPFFLSMSDHIFDKSLIEGLAGARFPKDGLVLAVDRKLNDIFDMEDATKVITEEGRIIKIGKELEQFDAVDSGLFLCSPALFDAIAEKSTERTDGDCSLSDGVEALASREVAWVHDIGEARWQDVDTPGSLAHAVKIFD